MACFKTSSGIIMANKLDLNTLRVFVAVVDEGSFAGAARTLALPSSNVSRYVAQLENSLGVRLLERSTRRLRMTEAGKLLHQRAKPMLDAVNQTAAELSCQQGPLRGVLKLCLPAELGPALLGAVVAEFAGLHPGVEIDCNTSLAGLEALRDDVDLAIIVHRGELDDSTLIVRALLSVPSVVVRPGHSVLLPVIADGCGFTITIFVMLLVQPASLVTCSVTGNVPEAV